MKAPCNAKLAMIAATSTSGQPVPVPNTPRAASNTAKLPRTSLRVQIHADRILASPPRRREIGDDQLYQHCRDLQRDLLDPPLESHHGRVAGVGKYSR
jgi:hypothetical protein